MILNNLQVYMPLCLNNLNFIFIKCNGVNKFSEADY